MKCERCDKEATCHVADLIETEPTLGTDGVLYSTKEDDPNGHHDLCWKHVRMPRLKKWKAPEGWQPPEGWNPMMEPITAPRKKS